ncbi:transcriptional regulator, BolA protein family [Pseudidiomarina planktonica]|uniref:DNA-binding transcriptional regulator BolA n=1 Tax=Pseudidiomarina planktonica TaxID=1323738 RepID=A0A1Y6ER20_9GAMM|nr:transcriptional regulator BolA [Pseudidiomarina planktonica]RUO65765.1 transcriptional regulator [Pseudidiomarina planktonica]SMQ62952.1 transcriptional regulator, BolA protein family [Pseudidiomarina planktonica]
MSIYLQIEDKLVDAFTPSHLEVVNESHMHSSGAGAESHFKVVLVSQKFTGERLLNRHRAVNKVLADELLNHIHALALHTYTEEEWKDLFNGAPMSPPCMGGSKRERR